MRILDCLRPAHGGPPDWGLLTKRYPWAREMETCPQDPIHHQEGPVLLHTAMVHEALVSSPNFQRLDAEDREVLEFAALLHDVGKPSTTREEDGRIRSPGHSVRGAIMARRILWEDGVPFRIREAVCGLIRFHQQPFHLLANENALKRLLRISVVSRCDLLAILAEADTLGRVCDNPRESLDSVSLFREYAEDNGCLDQSFPFPSDLSRFQYFQKEDRNPFYEAHDDTRGEVILLSGLPGAGKSTWIAEHAPAGHQVIGLDETREELGISASDSQGPVMQATKEKAKRIMGAKSSPKSFVWNATNISRQRRVPLISLATAYNYRVHIVYIEVSAEDQERQNREREHQVPADAMEGQFRQWEVPDLTEALQVEFVIR